MQQLIFENQFERVTRTFLPFKLERKARITPLENGFCEIAIVRQQMVSFENRMNAPMEATFVAKHLKRFREEYSSDDPADESVEFTDGQITISYVSTTKHCSINILESAVLPVNALRIAKSISDMFETTMEQNFEYRMNAPLITEAIAQFRKPLMDFNQPVLADETSEISSIVF